eukprot:1321658-Amphidinium_carterae.4
MAASSTDQAPEVAVDLVAEEQAMQEEQACSSAQVWLVSPHEQTPPVVYPQVLETGCEVVPRRADSCSPPLVQHGCPFNVALMQAIANEKIHPQHVSWSWTYRLLRRTGLSRKSRVAASCAMSSTEEQVQHCSKPNFGVPLERVINLDERMVMTLPPPTKCRTHRGKSGNGLRKLLKSTSDWSVEVSTLCKGCQTATESEMKVLCHVLLALHPNGYGDQYSVGQDVTRLLRRSSLVSRASMRNCVFGRCDEVVFASDRRNATDEGRIGSNLLLSARCKEAWKHNKYSSTDPVTFVGENKDIVFLVLDEKKRKSVQGLDEDAKLSTQRAELESLWQSSRTGALLFPSAYRVSLVAEVVAQKCFQGETIDTMTNVSSVALACSSVQRLQWNPVHYVRRISFEEAEMKLELYIRAQAVFANHLSLDALPGESLVRDVNAKKHVKICTSVMQEAQRARRQLKNILEKGVEEGDISYDDVEARFRQASHLK